MILNGLFLATIFTVGGLVVFNDIREKRISNKLIILGLATGAILIIGGLLSGQIAWPYVEKILLNTVLSFVAAFVIWQLDFWPAGDSKFFVFLSFLLPLSYYQKSYLEFFPSFVLLCNIFIIFLLAVLLRSFWTIFKKIKTICKTKQEIIQFRKEMLAKIRAGFFQCFSNKKMFLKNSSLFILQFGFVAMVYFVLIELIFKKNFNFAVAVMFFAIFYILRKMVSFDLHENSRKKIKSWDLNPGDNLDNIDFSKIKGSQEVMREVGKLHPEGLNIKQVSVLKTFLKKNDVWEIMVYKTVPFSIWMLLGAAVTIFLEGIIKISF